MRILRRTGVSALVGMALLAGCGQASEAQARTDGSTIVTKGNRGAPVVGSGRIGAQTRPIGTFDRLALAAPMDVTIRQGASRSLELRGDDNLLDLIETRVENGTLVVELRQGIRTRNGLEAVLTVPDLESVALNGSGRVEIPDWSGQAIDLTLGGSGTIELAGTTDVVRARIAGTGSIDLTGAKLREVEAVVAGSGTIRMGSVARLDAQVSGTGEIDAGDVGELSMLVSGIGSITYASARSIARNQVSGVGSTRRR